MPAVLYHSDKIKEKKSYQRKCTRKGAWHGMSVSSCLMSRQRKHVAFLIKYIQIRFGVFISANPYYKLFHLSIWQNNQENIVLSVPAAPSTSQSISHCLQCFTILYYFTTFICQLHHGAHRACFPQVQQNALLSKFLS